MFETSTSLAHRRAYERAHEERATALRALFGLLRSRR